MKSSWFFKNCIIGLLAVSIFIACQAEQPKNQKQSGKQTVMDRKDPTGSVPVKAQADAHQKIIVYYFHGNARCPTCYKLENYAKSEVEAVFSEAITTGKMEWKTINVEVKGNEHFSDDYKLYTKSIIVSTTKDGKELSWKNLDQIWQLVRDESKYREYIKREVKACLEGKCL